jgi:hypothetical protein
MKRLQVLGGDAKTFKAQKDDTYDKARDSKMYSGKSIASRRPRELLQ